MDLKDYFSIKNLLNRGFTSMLVFVFCFNVSRSCDDYIIRVSLLFPIWNLRKNAYESLDRSPKLS